MALPKYFTDAPSNVKRSQKHENTMAKEFNGKTQKGSGSQSHHKADVKSSELLIECKMTGKDSLSVKKEWLVKVWNESNAYGKTPALSIGFETMPGMVPKNWVAVPSEFLSKLIEFYKHAVDGK